MLLLAVAALVDLEWSMHCASAATEQNYELKSFATSASLSNCESNNNKLCVGYKILLCGLNIFCCILRMGFMENAFDSSEFIDAFVFCSSDNLLQLDQ